MKKSSNFLGRARRTRDIAITLLFAPAILLSACGSSDGKPDVDSGTCPAGQILRYESPGCGLEAKPVCGSSIQDACYRAVCSCTGVTISRCDYAPEPYSALGSCPVPDSSVDQSRDGLPDVASDLAIDRRLDVAYDVGLDGAIDGAMFDGMTIDGMTIDGMTIDGLTMDGATTDGAHDGIYDAGACPAGQVLRYEAPGCGLDAKPVCGSGTQDACYRAVCSCKGVTISRCDYAPEPFAAFGVCSSTDGGGPG